jgi:ATP synthase I chain
MTMEAKAADWAAGSIGRQTERRIGWLTLLFGFVATAVVAVLRYKLWAAGLAVGTVLGWLNFRWLKRAVDALVAVSTAQEGREKPKVPLTTYLAALSRYGLLGLTVYVIFVFLHVPLGSMILGFCALAAATIAASVWEILRPVD